MDSMNSLNPAARLAAALNAILTGLAAVVAAQYRGLGERAAPLLTRIGRANRRLGRLLALLAAGRLPRQSVSHPRPARPATPRLSRRRGWVVHAIGYQAAGHTSQLQYLLHDPAVAATLAAAPPRALAALARTLRPLCHILGVELPETLRAPPREKPPRPKRPKPAPLPKLLPLLPLLPQRRPRLILYPNPPRKNRPA